MVETDSSVITSIMEAKRPSRPPDLNLPPSFDDELPGGQRFTVHDVEQKIRSSSRRREFSSTRSRREQRREESTLDKYIWFAVAAIAAVYLGFLALTIVRPAGRPAIDSVPPVPVIAAPEPVAALPEASETETSPVAEQAPVVDTIPMLRMEETVAALKKADALYVDARRLARDRHFGEADAKFAEAVSLTPGRFNLLLDWSKSLQEQKRWAAARDQLIKAVGVEPDSIEARLALAQCCYQLRQMPDALALANWVLEAEPYSGSAHQIAADVLTGMERYESAIKHLQKLVALNSNNHIAENNLGMVYLRLGQYAQAISAFENVIRDEPGNSQAYYYLAQCFVQRNNPELAVDVLVRASQQFGRDFVVTWTKGPEFASLQDQPSFLQFFSAP